MVEFGTVYLYGILTAMPYGKRLPAISQYQFSPQGQDMAGAMLRSVFS
jgi:hypothetical protein